MKSASPRLTVVGSANVDLCLDLPSFPTPGETRSGGVFRRAFGGKGANAAVAAAQAGADVALVACVGPDANGAEMTANLRARKVDTAFVEVHPTTPTGVAFIFIDGQGQNMIGVAEGANLELTPTRIDGLRAQLSDADFILVQNEIPAETVKRVLQIAREEGVKVLYNCAPPRAIPTSLLALVEILVLNEFEAAFLSGRAVSTREEARMAARSLLDQGAKNVLITLGSGGVCVANNESAFHVPAYPVKAIDTVGAGDTFCGALAVACAEGRLLEDAVRFASAAAALSVTRSGAQNSAPTREEIEAFLRDRAG